MLVIGKQLTWQNLVFRQTFFKNCTVNSRYLEVVGTFLQVQITRSANYGWKSNQNVFFIQINALRFSEFEISEFEISRVDCMYIYISWWTKKIIHDTNICGPVCSWAAVGYLYRLTFWLTWCILFIPQSITSYWTVP